MSIGQWKAGLKKLCLDGSASYSVASGPDWEPVPGVMMTGALLEASRTCSLASLLATNGYTDSLSPWHQKRLIPISSTLVASEEIGKERVQAMLPRGCPVIDTKRVICLARPSPDGKRILFGGRARFFPMGPAESAKNSTNATAHHVSANARYQSH